MDSIVANSEYDEQMQFVTLHANASRRNNINAKLYPIDETRGYISSEEGGFVIIRTNFNQQGQTYHTVLQKTIVSDGKSVV